LYNHFQKVRNVDKSEIKKLFRERLLKLLQFRGSQWEGLGIMSLNNLLQEPNLLWQPDDLIKILESVASSDQLPLLQNYLKILKFVLDQAQGLQRNLITKILLTSCTWLPKLTAVLTSRSGASKQEKNIAFVTFKIYSSIYSMIQDWSQVCEEWRKI
ncbi:13027_t:CDS:1, partial [Acaulospora colombiana]